jgi:predicted amidohydrolase
MFLSLPVAAISLKPKPWDKPFNADKLEHLFRQAARTTAKLLLAPEGILEGYVIMDVIRDPARAEQLRALAEPLDGLYIRRFQRLARSLRRHLAFGFAQRIDDDVYNAAIFIDSNGRICGTCHKTQFAEGYDRSWWFNRIGRRIRAFDTPLGRIGLLICNDRTNPEISRTLVLDGARLLLIPSYGSRTRDQNLTVLARARENGVPVVQANVGMNLIISKGEIAAYDWGCDRITTAAIDIPGPPSQDAARRAERRFLRHRAPEMRRRYERTMKEKNQS